MTRLKMILVAWIICFIIMLGWWLLFTISRVVCIAAWLALVADTTKRQLQLRSTKSANGDAPYL